MVELSNQDLSDSRFEHVNLDRARFHDLGMRDVRITGAWTDERLAESTEPNTAPGYPEPESYPVRICLGGCVIEEWEHRRYIERDLDVLAPS